MDLQEKYDELDNIISSLNVLLKEITDEYYVEQLEQTKFEAQNELKEVSKKLQEMRDREEAEQEIGYWKEAI